MAASSSLERPSDAEQPLLRPEHGHSIILLEDADGLPDTALAKSQGASVYQAVFNLLNIYCGMGILTMPYAMRISGWAGLGALTAASAVFCLSGKLLIAAFDCLPPGSPHTFPALGMRALGPKGKFVVAAAAVAEFFGGSCIMIVIMFHECQALLPDDGLAGLSPEAAAVALSLAATVPLLLIPSLEKLSYLNFVGCASTVLVVATIVASVGLDPTRKRQPVQPPAGWDVVRLGVLQASGIFAVSVSGHSSLPVLRNSMRDKQEFDRVLNLGFGSLFLVYSIVAGFGYYYFGSSAHELVTTDLATNSPFSHRSLLLPGFTVDKLVSACILVNAITTYPSLLHVIQDMIWSVSPHSDRAPRHGVAVGMRFVTFVAGTCLALLAYDVLGAVMSIVGGFCSIACSLLMPSAFFLLLRGPALKRHQRVALCLLLALGASVLVSVLATNAKQVLDRRRHPSGTSQGLQAFVPLWSQ